MTKEKLKTTSDRRSLTPAQRWIVALSLLMLGLGVGNLVRMGVALHYAASLPDLPLTVPMSYLAAMGGLWGAFYLLCTIGLLRFRRWGRWLTLATVSLHQANVWINHLLFDASDYAYQTRPRDLALTLLLLSLFWGAFNLKSVHDVFKQRKEEH